MLDAEVIIAGAGPAGTSTAFFLARAGVDVLLLDRARFPRDKPCSEYLSPQGSRLLEAMGALGAVEAAGAARLEGMIVRAPSGARIVGRFRAVRGYVPWQPHGLALRRRVLDALLLERARAAGARVVEGARVADLERDGAGRVVGVRGTDAEGTHRSWRAPLVVGADGLRSVVARRLGLAHTARWPRRVALVTHYRGVEGLGLSGEMHVEADGYVGVARVDAGLANVAVVVPAARARAMAGDPAAFLERWIAARPHLAPRFAGAERVGPVRAVGPFAAHARSGWAPGAALVGDAADFFDPFTGEGMYAALRGGELLADYAREAARGSPHAADAALAEYDRRRRREFSGKWTVERLVGLAVAFPPLVERAARALSRRPDMADTFVGVTGDFVPAREVLRPGYVARLAFPWLAGLGAPALRESSGGEADSGVARTTVTE
jgi:menaquinone-9 beta-reductase